MNLSIRVFAILENDVIVRLPMTKFHKLFSFEKSTSFPEFKNKKIKTAYFIIELKNRKPNSMIREFYTYHKFNNEGKIDKSNFFEQARLTANYLLKKSNSNETIYKIGDNVFDATDEFAKKRVETEYRWVPSAILKNKLHSQIFK